MRRCQFYPNEELWKCLETASAERGVSVSSVVVEVLENYFALERGPMNKTDLLSSVFSEVRDFLDTEGLECEFDLLTASPTFSALPMFRGGRPNSVRAQIGRAFATAVRNGAFPGVEPARDGSGKILRSANHATIYRAKMSDTQMQEIIKSMYPNCTPDEIAEDLGDWE